MKIAIFYALEGEGRSIKETIQSEGYWEGPLKQWPGTFPGEISKGVIFGHAVVLVQTGFELKEGEGNHLAKKAADYVFKKYHPEVALVIGTCGGQKGSKHGDLVICSPVCAAGEQDIYPDRDLISSAARILTEREAEFCVAPNLTISVLSKGDAIAREYPGVRAFEMENYWIFSAAIALGICCFAIRGVSDTPEESRDLSPNELPDKSQSELMNLIIERSVDIGKRLRDELIIPLLQELRDT